MCTTVTNQSEVDAVRWQITKGTSEAWRGVIADHSPWEPQCPRCALMQDAYNVGRRIGQELRITNIAVMEAACAEAFTLFQKTSVRG